MPRHATAFTTGQRSLPWHNGFIAQMKESGRNNKNKRQQKITRKETKCKPSREPIADRPKGPRGPTKGAGRGEAGRGSPALSPAEAIEANAGRTSTSPTPRTSHRAKHVAGRFVGSVPWYRVAVAKPPFLLGCAFVCPSVNS